MQRWVWTGIVSTLIIVISIPLYTQHRLIAFQELESVKNIQADFVGTAKCKDCHKPEYDLWKNSHHDLAMDVANEETVLGDFNNAEFVFDGVTSRFYRKEGDFYVHTAGPDGVMGDFQITHTFGWAPLQQYLVPFPGGRYQCLPIAWDEPGKFWFHLYPDDPPPPDDWIYWTNAGQNWNGMCAECHSTNLKKNYNIADDTFNTTWSDIDVGCEACHGPGSLHLEWADLPAMARPDIPNAGLIVKTANLDSRQLVELCAPCHSRRAALGDYTHAEKDLLDSLRPSLLTDPLYFPDGQILDEVYVYASFTQSKMYHRDVQCGDCHNVHSVKRVAEDNDLCLQCHRAAEYDRYDHHFHKKKDEDGKPILDKDGNVLFAVGTGALCVECHMPGRYYMVNDYRPDHSFPKPRPDLSETLEVPNGCTRCHYDKSLEWCDETITKWYGPGRTEHFGTTLSAGRNLDPDACEDLKRIASDALYPVIVRATALLLLRGFPPENTLETYELALMDDEALIRAIAVEHFPVSASDPGLITPLLFDEVKAVRMQVAVRLAGPHSKDLNPHYKSAYDQALKEYIAAMEYSGDFAFGRFNLGNLYQSLDQSDVAEEYYMAALKIDGMSYPSMINLAMLLNGKGENERALGLFQKALELQPDSSEILYSTGLLLAEMNQLDAAAEHLRRSTEVMPGYPRIHYNLGLLQLKLQRFDAAENSFLTALELEPGNWDYLYVLADYYLRVRDLGRARLIVDKMVTLFPEQQTARDMLKYLDGTNR